MSRRRWFCSLEVRKSASQGRRVWWVGRGAVARLVSKFLVEFGWLWGTLT